MARLAGLSSLALLGAVAGQDVVGISELVSESGGIEWHRCPDMDSGALFSLESAIFDLNKLTVTAHGVLARELSGGNVTGVPRLGRAPMGATLWEKAKRNMAFAAGKKVLREELCAQQRRTGGQCPMAAGQQKLSFSLASLPAVIVAGELQMQLKATTQEGVPFLCLEGSLSVKRGAQGEIFRLLSESASGPCKHGSQFRAERPAHEGCMSHGEWKEKKGGEHDETRCREYGGRWDQANFMADGNGCKFDSKALCEGNGFTWRTVSCGEEAMGKVAVWNALAEGGKCDEVTMGGSVVTDYVRHNSETCCEDKRSVCELSGQKYKTSPVGPGPTSSAFDTGKRIRAVAGGLLGLAVVGLLL